MSGASCAAGAWLRCQSHSWRQTWLKGAESGNRLSMGQQLEEREREGPKQRQELSPAQLANRKTRIEHSVDCLRLFTF